MNAVLYIAMSIMDLIFVGGTIYLIDQRGWNPWWMAITLLLLAGTYPKSFLTKPTPAPNAGDGNKGGGG